MAVKFEYAVEVVVAGDDEVCVSESDRGRCADVERARDTLQGC